VTSQSAEFARRAALYTRCDARLCDYTRFYAAAAMINVVFAKRFAVMPVVRSARSFNFLSEVGSALENDNLLYARQISLRPPGRAFDYALVRAEQDRVQEYVRSHQEQWPQKWEGIRSELNGLLNRYAVSFLSRWCDGAGRLFRVLREVREQISMELDFADESHRIRIGLGLIEHIRRDGPSPQAAPVPAATNSH
jgi:hypothetical protein